MMLRWNALFLLLFMIGCQADPSSNDNTGENMNPLDSRSLEWHGHRGARGLAPENTLAGFRAACTYPMVTTLELDVVISKDSFVVVSHEPWMSSAICQTQEGAPVDDKAYNIFEMSYAEIARFDCGSLPNSDFPEQKPQPAKKPLLLQVFRAVNNFCTTTGRPLPNYNIELKARPEWDGEFTPDPDVFVELVLAVMKQGSAPEKSAITFQSFDPRILNEIHSRDINYRLSLLVANNKSVKSNLKELDFTPDVYSPNYELVNKKLVKAVHSRDMKLIPWTVNETAEMERLMAMGVDGIITDYPNRIPEPLPIPEPAPAQGQEAAPKETTPSTAPETTPVTTPDQMIDADQN
jgi:glycerophosphoryl diester phosphodiesterase